MLHYTILKMHIIITISGQNYYMFRYKKLIIDHLYKIIDHLYKKGDELYNIDDELQNRIIDLHFIL